MVKQKETRMVKDGAENNDQLKNFSLRFSRYSNHDVSDIAISDIQTDLEKLNPGKTVVRNFPNNGNEIVLKGKA